MGVGVLRIRSRMVVVVAAVCLLTSPGARASHAASTSFTYVGEDCEEAVVLLVVPADEVRRYIPDDVAVWEPVPGQALLGVAALSCGALSVDGRRARPGIVSDVGVLIDAPEGADPERQHFYQLWQLTDHRALRHAMEKAGVAGELVPDATYSAGAVTASATLPSRRGRYDLTVAAPSPVVPDADSGNSWWHRGDQGLVELRYSFAGVRVAAGAATLDAAPGSPLADMAPVGSSAGLRIGFARVAGELSVVRP